MCRDILNSPILNKFLLFQKKRTADVPIKNIYKAKIEIVVEVTRIKYFLKFLYN